MHMKNHAIALQTALALLAGSLMIGEAARTLEFQPEPSPQDFADSANSSLGGLDSHPRPPLAPTASALASREINHDVAKHSAIYTGTIVRRGSSYVLREPSGSLYRLDAPLLARPYESRLVRVTGDFIDSDNLLHIEQIENLPA